MFHRGWWLYECSFTWKQKADTKTWVRVLYWGGNTGKEEWGSMAIETGKKAEVDKAISGVHEDLIPIKTSGYVNYLLCLSICITRGVRAFVPRHSSCSVNIFFSWLHFKKCHLLRLFFFWSRMLWLLTANSLKAWLSAVKSSEFYVWGGRLYSAEYWYRFQENGSQNGRKVL